MSKGYDKLKERIGRVEKILGIRHKDPTDPALECKHGYKECPMCHPGITDYHRGVPDIPECMCPKPMGVAWKSVVTTFMDDPQAINVDCPVHGHTKWKKLIKDGINFKPECTCPIAGTSYYCRKHGVRKFSESLDPEPPLYARVAKHLGNDVWNDFDSEKWFYRDRLNATEKDPKPWLYIPRYDLDEKLAIGALEEYSKRISDAPELCFWNNHNLWVVKFQIDEHKTGEIRHESLPEAICLAIDKHVEGQ